MEGALLKGDGRAALELAARALPRLFPGPDLDYVRCVQSRLEAGPALDSHLDAFVAEALHLYQRYWFESLLDPGKEAEKEAILGRDLRAFLAVADDAGFDAIEPELSRQFGRRGYFVLLGRTPPLRELMIWKRQTLRTFDVALPEGRHTAPVVLLDEFDSFGWASWATCGRRATGGWATETALHAPVPRYRSGIEGSEFRAVFLAHETQHLADKQRFKDLQPWELEYRAKLAELWAADEVIAADRLAGFQDSQGDDPALAHAYANRRVVADLQRLLSKAPSMATLDEIRNAAAALLGADSGRRRSRD